MLVLVFPDPKQVMFAKLIYVPYGNTKLFLRPNQLIDFEPVSI